MSDKKGVDIDMLHQQIAFKNEMLDKLRNTDNPNDEHEMWKIAVHLRAALLAIEAEVRKAREA